MRTFNGTMYALVLVGVLACDSKGGEAASAPPEGAEPKAQPASEQSLEPEAKPGPKLCALVPKVEVEQTLGVIGLSDPKADGSPPVTVCGFEKDGNPVAVQIRFETGRNLGHLAELQKMESAAKPVSGVGEGAFSSSYGKVNQITAIGKNTQVQVVAMAPLDKVGATVSLVISRL